MHTPSNASNGYVSYLNRRSAVELQVVPYGCLGISGMITKIQIEYLKY